MIPRLFAFAVIILLAVIAFSVSEHQVDNAGLPLVRADYLRCVTIRNGPIVPEKGVIRGNAPISEIV